MSAEPNESSGEYVNTLYGRKPPRAQLPWILISAGAGLLVLICAFIWRANLTPLTFAGGAYGIGLGAGYVLLAERKRVWQWWRRVRPWGWETVRDTGITRYQVHPSGKRRAVQQLGVYQPIDQGWVETGEWTTHKPRGTADKCDHGLTFDADMARDMCVAKVRLKYPRLFGECPKGCKFSGIAYASQEHYVAGDW